MKSPEQADNVNVNVTMTGSGKGGIRDLIDILQNIQNGKDHDRALFGQEQEVIDDSVDYENDLEGVHTSGIERVTNPPSDGIHSPGNKIARHEDPADPYKTYSESTLNRLKSLYEEYK